MAGENDMVNVIMHFNERFDAHVSSELERHAKLLDAVSELTKSMQPLHDASKRVDEAFLKDSSGEPDFAGHCQDHAVRRATDIDRRAMSADVRKRIIDGAAVGGFTFMCYTAIDFVKAWLHKL